VFSTGSTEYKQSTNDAPAVVQSTGVLSDNIINRQLATNASSPVVHEECEKVPSVNLRDEDNEIVESSSPLKKTFRLAASMPQSVIRIPKLPDLNSHSTSLFSTGVSSLSSLSRDVLSAHSVSFEVPMPSTSGVTKSKLSSEFLAMTDSSMFSEDDTDRQLDPLNVCCLYMCATN